jgi:hypothetical protein
MRRISPTKERWKGFTLGLSCGIGGLGQRKKRDIRRTHVLKLDIAQFTKFCHGIVSNLGGDEELDEAHSLRASKRSWRLATAFKGDQKKESRNRVGCSSTMDVFGTESTAALSAPQ